MNLPSPGRGAAAAMLALMLCAGGSARGQGYPPPPPGGPPPPPYGAQPPPPPYGAPPPPPAVEAERSGVLLGGGLGFGTMKFSAGGAEMDYDTFALELYIGGMVTPRFALAVELISENASEDDGYGGSYHIHQNHFGAFARYWAVPRLWLQLGFATARAGDSESGDDLGGRAVTAGLGFEVIHKSEWALDLALRLMGTSYPDDLSSTSLAFLANLSWF